MRLGLWYEIGIVVWDWDYGMRLGLWNEISLRFLYLYCCIGFVRYASIDRFRSCSGWKLWYDIAGMAGKGDKGGPNKVNKSKIAFYVKTEILFKKEKCSR